MGEITLQDKLESRHLSECDVAKITNQHLAVLSSGVGDDCIKGTGRWLTKCSGDNR